jgi:hypothetical protein
MLGALRRAVDETLAFTSLIPADFVANKGSYYRFASGLMQPNFHLTAHLEQVKSVLAAAHRT